MKTKTYIYNTICAIKTRKEVEDLIIFTKFTIQFVLLKHQKMNY